MKRLTALAAVVLASLVVLSDGGSSPPASAGVALPPVGPYDVDVNIFDDPAGHDPFIGMPDMIELQVTIEGSTITIDGPEPWVSVSGGIKGDQIFASGIGTVAGFLDISVDFQGTLTAGGLGGLYSMGTSGGLPTEQPIIYELKPQEPPEKLFSITVLKRNGETKAGIPGWQINLYDGTGCTGDAIDSGLTGDDGLIEFTGLLAGAYSVEEKSQPLWNPEGPECQDVELGLVVLPADATAAGVLVCPISPDLPFPEPGCDQFTAVATVQVELTNPPAGNFECDLSGPTLITRGPVVSGPPDSIDTEIVAMDLTGTCQPGDVTITVRESPTQDSVGQITEQENNTPGTLEFLADSFFDIFFEIDTPIGTLHNQDALTVRCKIAEIPPLGCLYEPDVGVIPLFDETGKEAGTLLHAAHLPVDPNKVLVIFSNVPKAKITIPLGMSRLGNLQATLDTWTPQQITDLLTSVNTFWEQANINFTWPSDPDFRDIEDPVKQSNAGDGDVLDSPADLASGKTTEELQVCNAARDAANAKEFPVALIQHFVDEAPEGTTKPKSETLGLTFTKDDNAKGTPGICVLLSIQAKDNALVLAHEMGHALCLDHETDDPDNPFFDKIDDTNLMWSVKAGGSTLLPNQIDLARECAETLLAQLQRPSHGDGDCNDSVDAVDSLAMLVVIAGLAPLSQTEPCLDLGIQVGSMIVGDVDCNGIFDAIDSLKVLRHVANLPVAQEPGCPLIKSVP